MSTYNHIFFSALQNSEYLRVLIFWRQICYKHFGLSKVCFLKMPCYPNLNLNEILSLREGPLFQNSVSKINKTFVEKTFTNCHPICTLLYKFCFVTIFGVQTKILIFFRPAEKQDFSPSNLGNGKPHRIEPGLFHKNKSLLFLLILSFVQARSGSFS